MKKEQLFEVISDIDDEYVIDAEKVSKSKKKLVIRILASVACLALAVAVSLPFLFRSKTIDEKEVTEPEDIFVLPKDELRKNVKKEKIVYWEDWTSSEYLVYYGDGSRTVRADIGKELDRLTSYGNSIKSNKFGDNFKFEIVRKMPLPTEYKENMDNSEWQEFIYKFENIVGDSFYEFIDKAPDKWGYPNFYTLDSGIDGETIDYWFEYRIECNDFLYRQPSINLYIGAGDNVKFGVCDLLAEYYDGNEEVTVINGIPMSIYDADRRYHYYWVSFEMNGKPYEIEFCDLNSQYIEEFLYCITAESAKKGIIELPVRFPMDYEYKSDNMLREMYYLDHGIKYYDFTNGESEIWDGNQEVVFKFGEAPFYLAYGSGKKCAVISPIDESKGYEKDKIVQSERINSITVDFYSDFAVYEYNGNMYRASGFGTVSIDDIKELLKLILV